MLAERITEWTEQWQQEGWQKGHQQGRQEGRQEGVQLGRQEGVQLGRQEGVQLGQAQLLQKQLEMRFGPLPDWVLAYLRDASTEELGRWSLRIFDQPNLQDIFH